ncbi:MAG: crotonase [Firmicutes bacterium]|nr:crotonase [Bacillota bacterium]
MVYAYDNLICSFENNIMLIKINRPAVLNALNSAVFEDLYSVFQQMKEDDDVRVVILTGTGDKSFAAGSDVSEMSACNLIDGRKFALGVNRAQQAIANFPRPTIVAINGFAFGGGLEVAMCCDIRIASQAAKMANPEINVGLIPGGGGTQRLARMVGSGMAKEIIFTCQTINAETALRIGLVNRVVSPEKLLDEALEMAKTIASKSPVLMTLAKQAINIGQDLDLENALKVEVELFAQCFGTEDGKEGLSAFVEKRKPVIKGR